MEGRRQRGLEASEGGGPNYLLTVCDQTASYEEVCVSISRCVLLCKYQAETETRFLGYSEQWDLIQYSATPSSSSAE
jgi:hypothetical protein